MKYTRRHYIDLARLLAKLRADALHTSDVFMLETVDLFIARLTTAFMADNPHFVPQRFINACKVVTS